MCVTLHLRQHYSEHIDWSPGLLINVLNYVPAQ